MLLKPVNPSPIHTAIDANVDNEFSCEVTTNNVVNSQFCLWDDNGDVIYQDRGFVADKGLKYNLLAETIKNGANYSWDIAYWGEINADKFKSISLSQPIEKNNMCITLSNLNSVIGYPHTTNINQRNGFWMYGADDFGCARLLPSLTEANEYLAKIQQIQTEISSGESYYINYYDKKDSFLKSLEITSIWTNTVFQNNVNGTYTLFYEVYVPTYVFEEWMNNVSRFAISTNQREIAVGDFILLNKEVDSIPYKITAIVDSHDTYTATLSCPISSAYDITSVFYIPQDDLLYNTSPEYYFRTRITPSFNFLGDFGNNIDNLDYTLSSHFNTFFIGYSGAELGEYQIIVSACKNNTDKFLEIYKTDKNYNPVFEQHSEYGKVIRFTYDGFVSGITYKIEVVGKTIEGDNIPVLHAIFDVDYSTILSSDIIVEPKDCCVDIKLTNPWEIDESTSLNDENKLIIYRKSQTSLSMQRVCEVPLMSLSFLDGSLNHIEDYNVSNGIEYTYLFAIKSHKNDDYDINSGYYAESMLYESLPILLNSREWYVIEIDEDDNNGYTVNKNIDNIWSFGLNVEPSPYKTNYDKTVYDGFNKYASIGTGKRNYVDFSISALLGSVSCEGKYYDDIDMINSWSNFCASPSVKLYKDPKGTIMLVEITGMDRDNTEIITNELPTTIKVEFIQIGDTYNIPIYTWELI